VTRPIKFIVTDPRTPPADAPLEILASLEVDDDGDLVLHLGPRFCFLTSRGRAVPGVPAWINRTLRELPK